MGDVASAMQALGATRNRAYFFSQLRTKSQMPTTPVPYMRGMLLTVVVLCGAAALPGCRCSPQTPSPVTLRVVNAGVDPIYVDLTRGTLGLTLQRDVGGTLYPFDDLACECRQCDRACDSSCTCPAIGQDLIRRIGGGESAERVWDGVVQVAGLTSCGDGTCLSQVNAPLNEPFTLELCFSAQPPLGVSFEDGGVGAGQLPKVSQTCVTKKFEPRDGVVEIGPGRGAACESNAQCLALGGLCLGGSCTSGCPPNGFPEWYLLIPSPENMGFFTQVPRATGNAFTGTGTLTSFLYTAERLELHLSRVDAATSETLTATLSMTLPTPAGAPLQTGAQVTVLVVDDGQPRPGRAFTIRDAVSGHLLLAADMRFGEPLLDATELAPVTVGHSGDIIGCRTDGCGKLLFTAATFSSEGKTLALDPGQQGDLELSAGRYRFLNVSSGSYASTRCDFTALRPWIFWRQAPP